MKIYTLYNEAFEICEELGQTYDILQLEVDVYCLTHVATGQSKYIVYIHKDEGWVIGNSILDCASSRPTYNHVFCTIKVAIETTKELIEDEIL